VRRSGVDVTGIVVGKDDCRSCEAATPVPVSLRISLTFGIFGEEAPTAADDEDTAGDDDAYDDGMSTVGLLRMVACGTLLLLGEDAGCGACTRCLRCGEADRSIMLLERPHRSRGEPRSPAPSSPISTSRSFRRRVAIICSCCCRLREADNSGVRRCKKKGDKRSGVVRIASFSASAGGGGGGGGEEDRILDIALLFACPASGSQQNTRSIIAGCWSTLLAWADNQEQANLSLPFLSLLPSDPPPTCLSLFLRIGTVNGSLVSCFFSRLYVAPCGLLHD